MIKMIYEQEPYNFEGVGGQAYDIKTEINMVQDASAQDILEAVVRLMQTATYHVDARLLMEFAKDYAYEHNQEDLIDNL